MQKLLLTLLLFGMLWLGSAPPARAQDHPAADIVETAYWQHRVDLFRRLPNPEEEIVFLGDSITDGCEWSELTGLPHVTNRGISGDTAWGIMARIEEVTASRPAKVFLMIGTNDLARGQTVAEVHAKIAEIIDTIQQQTPETELYLQSVLPVADREDWSYQNEEITALNERLASLAGEEGITWVDVAPVMRDETGQLNPELTADGLHLNGKGYYLWYSVIRKYLDR